MSGPFVCATEWGGCRLTDESSREEIEALAGREFFYYGRAGIAESIRLIEGDPPWGQDYSRPRPVYSVVWRSLDG
jgi:hypothetical protein